MKLSYLTLYSFLLALLMCYSTTNLSAQTDEMRPKTEAKTAIQDLKKGVLIVRLPSHAKKIAAMEDLMKNKKVSKSNKENLKKQITLTKKETQLRNLAIVKGFKTAYDFSDVLFIYDHNTKAIQEGQATGVFLDKRLKVDESLDLNNRSYLFARFGKTDVNTTTGVEGIIITDKNLVDLGKPFPAYVREGGFRFLVDKAFDKKNADKRNMPRMVEKLNKNLKRYAAVNQ